MTDILKMKLKFSQLKVRRSAIVDQDWTAPWSDQELHSLQFHLVFSVQISEKKKS